MIRTLEPEELRGLIALEVRRPLRALQGRETFLHRTADGRAIVVKRARPGARPGGRREHEALVRLAELGLPVPVSFGFAAGPAGSVVAMERVEHVETARDRLERGRADERRALLERIAALLAQLHRAGWCHRDFYAHHLLLREPRRELVLIDVGRAGRAPIPRGRWFVKDVGALLSSLPHPVGDRERLAFVARYLDRRGVVERRARRRFLRAALAKARRIAAHRPVETGVPRAGA